VAAQLEIDHAGELVVVVNNHQAGNDKNNAKCRTEDFGGARPQNGPHKTLLRTVTAKDIPFARARKQREAAGVVAQLCHLERITGHVSGSATAKSGVGLKEIRATDL
jgi:hypothetical protein